MIFAYGSNMCEHRLRTRVPSTKLATIAKLPGHQLRFHKRSNDGSAKCDAHETGNAADEVWGVVFRIDAADKPKLDRAEGLGHGYDECKVEVITPGGRLLKDVQMYYATDTDATLRPYEWYRRYVLNGAVRHNLPEDYVQDWIVAIPTVPDPDFARRSQHEPTC